MKNLISSLFVAALFLAASQDSIASSDESSKIAPIGSQEGSQEALYDNPWDPRGSNNEVEAENDDGETEEGIEE